MLSSHAVDDPTNNETTKSNKIQKMTYGEAIVAALQVSGILSRAAVASWLAIKYNLNNAQHVATNLKRLKAADRIELIESSYALGSASIESLSAPERKAYYEAMKKAEASRKSTADAKLAGQKREAKRVSKALKAAQTHAKKSSFGSVSKQVKKKKTDGRDSCLLSIGQMAGL